MLVKVSLIKGVAVNGCHASDEAVHPALGFC